MQRWHLTLGLSAAAFGAALLAPKLLAPAAEVPPAPPILEAPPPIPVVEPEPATVSGHLTVSAGLDRTAVLHGQDSERFLTVTVGAADGLGEAVRRPVDLAVVMDTSGSMSARGKIDQARRAAKLIASRMHAGDTYSLVVFNDDATVVVPATAIGPAGADPTGGIVDVGVIHRAIDRIYEGGGTNLFAGMDRGAREVRTSIREGAIGRVVLLSDGNANVGVTDPGALDRFAQDLSSQGVTLSAIGLGLDYNEDVLARLADVGGGTYDFVDDATELEQVFADELERTASVVARGTRVHLSLPPGVDPVEVIGWDAARSGDGWDVFLGDVYSGDTKKIVTRVRVKGDALGEKRIARVTADYTDVIDASEAVAVADAYATVTAHDAVVDASVDKARAVDASRALGSWYLDRSTRAYERGDRARSRELAVKASAILRSQADVLGERALAVEASEIEAATQVFEMHAPSSAAGRTAIKKNKEIFRDASR